MKPTAHSRRDGRKRRPHHAWRHRQLPAAGVMRPKMPRPESWDGLIALAKRSTPDRLFVVSSNNLGSSYGTQPRPASNPATAALWSRLPGFLLVDVVNVATNTPSSIWAVQQPRGSRRSVVWRLCRFSMGRDLSGFHGWHCGPVSAPRVTAAPDAVENLVKRLATDPNWNGGWYYDRGRCHAVDDEYTY